MLTDKETKRKLLQAEQLAEHHLQERVDETIGHMAHLNELKKQATRRSSMATWITIFTCYEKLSKEDKDKVSELGHQFREYMFDGGPAQEPLNELIQLLGLH